MKNSIIIDGIVYYKESPEAKDASVTLEKYKWLVAEIRQSEQEATELYENMQEEGLNFSTIEAEGYLRAMKVIYGKMNYIEECLSGTDSAINKE
jgi:hypothetical protein